MPGLQTVNTLIKAVCGNSNWHILQGFYVTRTLIPPVYNEANLNQSITFLNHFLKHPKLEQKFSVARSTNGRIIQISVPKVKTRMLIEELPQCLAEEHVSIADAIATPRSRSESYFHIEFPKLTKLVENGHLGVVDAIQSLVKNDCWFSLSTTPSVHVIDRNRTANLLQIQINNLNLFHPDRAVHDANIKPVQSYSEKTTTGAYSLKPVNNETKGVIDNNNNNNNENDNKFKVY